MMRYPEERIIYRKLIDPSSRVLKMDIVEKSWEVQGTIEDRVKRIGKGKYGRVIKMARKPTPDEYVKTVMITGIGIILIGGLGFAIYLIWQYLPGLFG